jgi:hypothetical protein
MNDQRGKEGRHQRACELLSRELHVPIDDVKRLYEDEWARLALGARMTDFLAILTLRNVRTSLRERGKASARPG